MTMKLPWTKRKPMITTTYACGHEQLERALNFTGRGWCMMCEAEQIVIMTGTGWL